VTVTPVADTKTVGPWKCTGYDATLTMMGMPMQLRVWASTDVPASLVDYAAKVTPAFCRARCG